MYSNFSTKIKFKDYRANDLYLEAACRLGCFTGLVGEMIIPIMVETSYRSEKKQEYTLDKFEDMHLFKFKLDEATSTWVCIEYSIEKYIYRREKVNGKHKIDNNDT